MSYEEEDTCINVPSDPRHSRTCGPEIPSVTVLCADDSTLALRDRLVMLFMALSLCESCVSWG